MVRPRKAETSWVTLATAASLLGVKEGALYSRIQAGTMPPELVCWKVLGQWRFDQAALLAYTNGPYWQDDAAGGSVWTMESDGSLIMEPDGSLTMEPT